MKAALTLAVLLLATSASAAECTRPTDAGGANGYDYGTATVASFGNASVLVWYTVEGPHAVRATSTRSDGVPDDVALVADVTADALAQYATRGFRSPVSDATSPSCGSYGGDGRLDVYLVAMSGADGQTVFEGGRCTTASACAAYVMAKSNFSSLYPSEEVGVRTVLPHETFHVVQNAYDVGLDRFWAEGTAQWAAKQLDPALTDLERFLPSFFDATGRALDAPANGVTADFLYGSAIWPVFLTARHGDDIVRAILDAESTGASALKATDTVLLGMQSSLAAEYPLFAAWNVATGTRAGQGGYADAATYPLVPLTTLDESGVQDISAGLASFSYHVTTTTPLDVSIDADPARTAATMLPLVDGKVALDRAAPLPARITTEAIVVVSGITTSHADAPFALSLAAAPDMATAMEVHGSGCSVASHESTRPALACLLIGLYALVRRARSGRTVRSRARHG